ncbi:MAG: hypothetical protein ABL930_11455 [Pseudobdellovibrio sp.]
MKSLLISISLLSSLAFAETATINIEGMHCSGCKAMVDAKVCKDAATNKDFASCEVKLVDEEKQTGQVTIVTKEGMKVNIETVTAGIKAAGDDYKVASVDVKDIKMNGTLPAKDATLTTTTTTTETSTTTPDGKTVVKKEVKTKKIAKKAAAAKKENK